MLFSAGRLAYRNYELSQEEEELRTNIASLELEIQDLRNKIVYFQSDAYTEKMIRSRLNMKKEGEQVMVVLPPKEAEEVVVEEDKRTNPQKWFDYLFGR